jgi:hypothetical protein
MYRAVFAGLMVAVSLFASPTLAELIIWLKPIDFSDKGVMPDGTTPNVEIFNSYDSGGTATSNAATGDLGNLGVRINKVPASYQTITFKVIATVHGTDTIATNDQMGIATFDILNSSWVGSSRGLLVGIPNPLTLTASLGETGSSRGTLATTDLTGDIAPDLGGSFDTESPPLHFGPWIRPLTWGRSIDGQAASTVDAHYTNLDVGTFFYSYGSGIARGTAAQLEVKTIYTTNLSGWTHIMACWYQDSTSGLKRDYSGYKGTNCIGGPAVPIVVSATPEPSTLALLAIGTLGLVALAWRRRIRRV